MSDKGKHVPEDDEHEPNTTIYRPHPLPRQFEHTFCNLNQEHLFTHYIPTMDPHFFTGGNIIYDITAVWHSNQSCCNNAKTHTIFDDAKQPAKAYDVKHWKTFHYLPKTACFILGMPYNRHNHGPFSYRLLFACPDCVFRDISDYTIVACELDITFEEEIYGGAPHSITMASGATFNFSDNSTGSFDYGSTDEDSVGDQSFIHMLNNTIHHNSTDTDTYEFVGSLRTGFSFQDPKKKRK